MTAMADDTQPVPLEFVVKLDGEPEQVFARVMCARPDLERFASTARGHQLHVTKTTPDGAWGFVECQGNLADLRHWLPEADIRRMWYPPLAPSVVFDTGAAPGV